MATRDFSCWELCQGSQQLSPLNTTTQGTLIGQKPTEAHALQTKRTMCNALYTVAKLPLPISSILLKTPTLDAGLVPARDRAELGGGTKVAAILVASGATSTVVGTE
jgi:hypothetical protein